MGRGELAFRYPAQLPNPTAPGWNSLREVKILIRISYINLMPKFAN